MSEKLFRGVIKSKIDGRTTVWYDGDWELLPRYGAVSIAYGITAKDALTYGFGTSGEISLHVEWNSDFALAKFKRDVSDVICSLGFSVDEKNPLFFRKGDERVLISGSCVLLSATMSDIRILSARLASEVKCAMFDEGYRTFEAVPTQEKYLAWLESKRPEIVDWMAKQRGVGRKGRSWRNFVSFLVGNEEGDPKLGWDYSKYVNPHALEVMGDAREKWWNGGGSEDWWCGSLLGSCNGTYPVAEFFRKAFQEADNR
jgi:hypothetical protein